MTKSLVHRHDGSAVVTTVRPSSRRFVASSRRFGASPLGRRHIRPALKRDRSLLIVGWRMLMGFLRGPSVASDGQDTAVNRLSGRERAISRATATGYGRRRRRACSGAGPNPPRLPRFTVTVPLVPSPAASICSVPSGDHAQVPDRDGCSKRGWFRNAG